MNIFGLEYRKRFPFVTISKSNLFAIFFIAMVTGIGAFIMETVLDYIAIKMLVDRGFLCGPFIPMYFFVVFFGLLYIKTPKRTVKNYFLFAFILAVGITVVEFAVGNLYELMFKGVLWTYDGFVPLSYKYISLPISLGWGLLGTAYLFWIVPLFKKWADRISVPYQKAIVITFGVCFLLDCILTIILIARNGWVYQTLFPNLDATTDITMLLLGTFGVLVIATLFGFFLAKKITYAKPVFLILYVVSLIFPLFSCRENFYRFQSPFFAFLSSMGFVIGAFYIYFVPVVLLLFALRWLLFKTTKKAWFSWPLGKTICFATSIVASTIVVSVGCWNIENASTTHLTIGSGSQKMNIIALSDIHYGTMGFHVNLEKMAQRINEQEPDVVLLLGDILDDEVDNLDHARFINAMASIESTYGIYAVTGNHELERNPLEDVEAFFESTNVNLLVDETVIINNAFQLVGRLDAYFRSSRDSINSLIDSQSSLPVIVMDHQPQAHREAEDAGAILQLSGHTHNGQLFPANWVVDIFYRLMYNSEVTNGLYQYDDFSVYVTKGYGGWGFPLRTTGRSEIVQIDFLYDL